MLVCVWALNYNTINHSDCAWVRVAALIFVYTLLFFSSLLILIHFLSLTFSCFVVYVHNLWWNNDVFITDFGCCSVIVAAVENCLHVHRYYHFTKHRETTNETSQIARKTTTTTIEEIKKRNCYYINRRNASALFLFGFFLFVLLLSLYYISKLKQSDLTTLSLSWSVDDDWNHCVAWWACNCFLQHVDKCQTRCSFWLNYIGGGFKYTFQFLFFVRKSHNSYTICMCHFLATMYMTVYTNCPILEQRTKTKVYLAPPSMYFSRN